MKTFLTVISISAIPFLAACGAEGGTQANRAAAADQNAAAPARSANAADSIKARQTHYKQIGRAMKGINDEMKAGTPSVQVIQAHAAQMRTFAPQIQGWFPSGSGSEAGLKTRARQEIWSDPAGFRRASMDFVAATERFHSVAQGGDMEAIRSAMPALGASCKGCHDKYRAPEE